MVSEILTEIFPHKQSKYDLRNSTALQGRSIKTGMYDLETIKMLPIELKNIAFPTLFKKKIICAQTPKNSPTRLCKIDLQNIGFL